MLCQTCSANNEDDREFCSRCQNKLLVLSGVTAFVHSRATSRALLAVFGALTALSALGALFLGIVLAS